MQAKAVACEGPALREEPLSRYSLHDIALILQREKIVSRIHPSTLCRWFQKDALRPWRYHSWLFRRDPDFLAKATVVLDLYHRLWQEQALGPDDYVLSADEKSGLQVLARLHPTRPSLPSHPGQVEFEYERLGTVTYQAALDVRRGLVFGQVRSQNGIATFDELVDTVMSQPPYSAARRVFWIVDNGSSHHPATFPTRLSTRHEHAIAVHLPVHASWLNQIELYFSILQRKALTPRDFHSVEAMTLRILAFQQRFSERSQPFHWRFSAQNLRDRMAALN